MAETEGNGAGNGSGAGYDDLFRGLEFRCVGPHRGGRVVAVAGHPSDPKTFYFGACAGGVWKTTNGGQYWECVSDGFLKTAAVGAIAVSDSDPNVIYAGMGETCIRGNVSHGDGVYRSTDGGKTWAHLGLADTRHIARVRIHPDNPDHVYVAALGHAFGPNKERGLYRSTDGGRSWEQILFRDETTGAIDLSMDSHNPRILYAAFWDVQRQPWHLRSGGPGSSLYRSIDGGDTWQEITRNEGLPQGVLGKIGVAVSPAKPDRVWALIEAKDGALFRSDDGGDTWQRLSEEGGLRRRNWYYIHLYAAPRDADTCWVLNMACWKSTDGGATFSPVPTPHGDNHDLWIDPRDTDRMIEGNDGGACVTYNGAVSWSTLWNQPTAQFYHVTTDNQFPYRLYGSQQDNSALSVPSASVQGVISTTEWFVPGGGESGYIAVRPDNPNIVYGGAVGSGFFEGYLTRFDRRTGQERNITVWPDISGFGIGAGGAKDLKYRFQWTFPVVLSPHDPSVLYAAANVVLRTADEGTSWEVISPDLTRNDKSKQETSGGPITRDNTGVEIYDTIFSFAESPHERGVFWTGSDDGLIHISRDGGKSWQNITPPQLPEWSLVSIIDLSPHDPATAYVAATRYKLDDPRPYLFKTDDYGASWHTIVAGIPEDDFTRVIREDPGRPGLLFCGTETGIYVSFDDGGAWQRLQSNLPVAPIHDLIVHDDDLVVATHGRSFWILDDITPLRRIAEQRPSGVHLFPPRPTKRFLTYAWPFPEKPSPYLDYTWAGGVGAAFSSRTLPDGMEKRTYLDAGENPPNGVIVTYYLAEKPGGDITLTFLDESGTEIKQFSSKKPPKKKPDEDDEEAEGAEVAQLEVGAEGLEGAGPLAAAVEEPDQDEMALILPKRQGTNRFAWNMRWSEPTRIAEDKSLPFLPPGPAVLPGRYQVRLQVGEQTSTEWFEIVPDPRGTASREDLQKQYDLLMHNETRTTETHDAVIQIRDIVQQLDGWEKRLKGREQTKSLAERAGTLKKTLVSIERELAQKKADDPRGFREGLNAKPAGLIFYADFVDFAPTHAAYEVFGELGERLDRQLERLRDFIATDLVSFNHDLSAAEIPAVLPKEAGRQASETKEKVPVGERWEA